MLIELIRAGLYDVVIAGGADELHYISSAVFDVVQAASRKYNDSPDLTPRPFDKARDGLVVSEGAGIVVMESDRHAQARGARPLAEFLGGAYLCDGSHMSQSSEAAMTKVINLALDRVNLHKDSIDYVNAIQERCRETLGSSAIVTYSKTGCVSGKAHLVIRSACGM